MPKANLKRKILELKKKIADKADEPISAVLNRVLEQVFWLTRANGAAIALRDSHGLSCRASLGLAPPVGARLLSDSGFTRECFETGQVVLCEDVDNDPRIRPAIARALHLRSALAIPILAQGSVRGVILVFSSSPFSFHTADVATLQRIAQSLSSISAPEPAQDEPPVTGGRVAAAPLAFSLAEDQPAARLPLVMSPLERPIDSPRATARAVAGKPISSGVTLGIFQRLNARAWLAAGSALSFLFLLLFFALSHSRSTKTPAGNPRAVETRNRKNLDLPSRLTATHPDSKGLIEIDLVRKVITPASPALVIEGAPRGTQIFVDDRLTGVISLSGQAKISTVAPGQHRLRLTLNGYQDYELGVDLHGGQTSTVTAKLKPFELPALIAPANAPILPVTPAIPPAVISKSISSPDFVLARTLKGHTGWVTTMAFSPDGQRLATGSWDQTIKFWEVSTGEQLSTTARKNKEIEALAFSRDGRWLATENSSNTVTLRDARTGQELRELANDKPLGPLGSNWVYSIAFSPDGRWLATGVDDKTVRVWDVNKGTKVRDLTTSRRRVIYIAFSPDGRRLASGDDDKTIRIWNIASGEEVSKLSGHRKSIYAVVFSPNGRLLASASGDKSVRLWDVDSGREIHTLTGHGNVVTSLAFSPDGRWLVSGSWDKTIKIWEVETGREVRTLAGHDQPVYSLAFDSHGRWLASGSEDGTIKLWRLTELTGESRLP
jgi:WD40 repeat protein/putative methionine-R-sulfoxide reductase with GAF domain